MELKKISIENFRSIKKENLEFSNNCIILVGKNEAGKSNLLKAVAGGLSQEAFPFTDKDKRTLLDNENYENQKYQLDFEFSLDTKDVENIFKNMNSDIKIVYLNRSELSFKDFFIQFYSKGIYHFDFYEMTSSYQDCKIQNDFDVRENIYQVLSSFSTKDFTYSAEDFIDFNDLDDADLTPSIINQNFKKTTKEDLQSFCQKQLELFMKKSMPKVYFWHYDEKLLIPDRVPLQNFINNPTSTNKPLANIFDLAGISDITTAFNDCYKRTQDYDELLTRVSNLTTTKLQNTWKELKLNILLSENANEIRIKIQEKGKYNVSARSDGFKKFISILCILASPAETGKISNSVIVLDEPDSGLYPTGAGYLRDMLIKMSANNIVLYATHNPCMIDKTTPDRHIIVEKKDDITTLKTDLTDSKFRDDEVLLRSIGMSAFENIKEVNLLFEGWTDYKIFNTAINHEKDGYKKIIRSLNTCGSSYGNGTNSLKNIISTIKLLEKKTVVILDADQEGKDKKNRIYQEFPDDVILTLDDLGEYKNFTVEDFIVSKLINKAIANCGQKIEIPEECRQPIMGYLSGLTKPEKQQIKNYIGHNVKITDILPCYFDFLKQLNKKIGLENDQ